MIKKILNKHIAKGDSWMDCDIQYLQDKLLEEFGEYLLAKSYAKKASELIDLTNVAMMLWKRLKPFNEKV